MYNEYMNMAIKQAEIAKEKGEIPVGAVVVKDGKVIAEAFNMKETTKNATAHAEILAIAKAGEILGRWQLYDCELYVTLQPCSMCKGAIKEARLKALYFGAYDKTTEFKLPETEVYGGIMEDKCTELLKDFFEKIR